MAKIQEKQFRARLPKTSHDLSQRNIFTAASGMLLPIWQDMALPGDKYYLDSDVFVRSQPLLTAAMADIDFSVDYFFVPLTMLYTPLQSQLWSTQDYISSSLRYEQFDKLPLFDWMDYFTNITSDLGALGDLPLFNEDLQHNQFERFGKSCIRLMSHLRYNYKMFLPYMVNPSVWEGDSWPHSSPTSPKFFPWQLLAYHTIYYKHYRNEDFEADNLSFRNFDYAANGNDLSDFQPFDKFLPFFCCHYLTYKKDYFLSASPTPVFNDVSLINSGSSLTNIRDAFLSQRDIRTGGSNGDSQPMSNATQTIQSVLNGDPQVVPQYGLGTNDLRKMFAMEKLLRITGRSEKSYDAQVLAHFGFEVPRDVLHNLSFLGSHKGKVHIGEVIATANTATHGTNLGEIAGRGYGKSGNNRQIKFTAPCHGAIMAIFHCQPETNYVGGFDRINAIGDISDFYNPEYDKLGKQPIYQYEVDCPWQAHNIEFPSKRLGWQYRYSQWKRKYNVISPAFSHAALEQDSFNNWNSWVIEQRLNGTFDLDIPSINNYTSHVSPRITDSIFAQSFEPRWHDEFLQSPWLIFQYDPFLVNSFISCKKVSVMSQTGEPDIDGI